MSLEIELKFAIPPAAIADAITFFDRQTFLEKQQNYLINTYYETATNELRRNSCGLRVRGTSADGELYQYEITLKKEGTSLAGLHQRNEFNADLTDQNLDIAKLPQGAFPKTVNVATLQQNLLPLFTTNFKRNTWLIAYQSSQIEVALDQGNVVADNNFVAISEIELEIKMGNVTDLLCFARQLTSLNLRLFSLSKAARGYCLVNKTKISKPAELNLVDKTTSEKLIAILDYWQQYEEFILNVRQSDFINVLHQIIDVIAQVIAIDEQLFSLQEKQSLVDIIEQLKQQSAPSMDYTQLIYSKINTDFKLQLLSYLI